MEVEVRNAEALGECYEIINKQREENEALKLGVWRAINILDNDLHACRAINARAELQELIDQFGEPDYEGEE